MSAAVPSLRGRLVALRTAPCRRSYFNDHLVLENWRTHRKWSIGADARPCHGLSNPGWNAAGTQLVFIYAPSRLKPGQKWPAETFGDCLSPRAGEIATASAEHASTIGSWRLIRSPSGCTYESAAFIRRGIAAFEACSPHMRGQNYYEGSAFLVALSRRGKVLSRTALKRRPSIGSVLSDPVRNVILVSEDQTYSAGHSTQDWVWQLRNGRLRLIASYPFSGQEEIAAQPW